MVLSSYILCRACSLTGRRADYNTSVTDLRIHCKKQKLRF
uniref:Uncharacterized protein n=1 Tax=Anguilla anguilla TaxID=7936 RepID=A0A0E9TZU3_ANGAN